MEWLLLIAFAFGLIVGCGIVERHENKVLREQYNSGYDEAVRLMVSYNYYIDANQNRHTGVWIEMDEEDE